MVLSYPLNATRAADRVRLRFGRFFIYIPNMKQQKDWFKPKKYPHIGLPLEPKDRHKIASYVMNRSKVAHHSFLPLIQRIQVSYRYKEKDGVKKREPKKRLISYSSHLDAQIYSFYGQLLETRYENYISKHGYGECVIAYRSLPRENNKGSKCNIDLANDAFVHIRNVSKNTAQIVIIADIKSFFDTLDHKLLKEAWKEISDTTSLSEDEYAVFKNVTKYAWVNAQDLFHVYRRQIICQQKTKVTNRTLASMRYFRDKNAIAFCDKTDIEHIRKSGMIHRNNEIFGIPQGLPISAVLANMYMWGFDRQMYDLLKQSNGYYRRYSDDIIIVCNYSDYNKVSLRITELISEIKLTIADDKTKVFLTKYENGELSILDKKSGNTTAIEYLGLAFDGSTIRLKNKSISKYYHKMKRTVNAKTHFAINKTDKTTGKLFVQQLLRKFTPIGSTRHMIFRRNKINKSLFEYTGLHSFGNYWTYVKKASKICDSPSITHQLTRNKSILKKRIIQAKYNISNLLNKKRLEEFLKYRKVYH